MGSLFPQHAFRIFSQTTKFKVNYIMRTTSYAHLYATSYETSVLKILDVLFGSHLNQDIAAQLSAPINEGGLCIEADSRSLNEDEYSLSLKVCSPAIHNILKGIKIPSSGLSSNNYQLRREKPETRAKELENLANSSDIITSKMIKERSCINASLWLHTIPFKWKPLWTLSKMEFQDGLMIRYNLIPLSIPVNCPAPNCGKPFTIVNADSCKYAGLIIRRHDRVKTIIGKHAERAFGLGAVALEPTLGTLTNEAREMIMGNKVDSARADILVSGFLNSHSSSFFDVSIISPICPSNINYPIENILKKTEIRKRKSYEDRILKQFGGNFSPFVISSGGVWGLSALKIMKTIADRIAGNQHELKVEMRRAIRTDISMSLLRSKVQSFHAPRQDVRGQIISLRNVLS